MDKKYLLLGVSLLVAILLCTLSWGSPPPDEAIGLRQFLFSPLQHTPQLIEDTLPLPDSFPSLAEQKEKLLNISDQLGWEEGGGDEVITTSTRQGKIMTVFSTFMQAFLSLYSK